MTADSNADSNRPGRPYAGGARYGRRFDLAAVPGQVRTRCTELVSEMSAAEQGRSPQRHGSTYVQQLELAEVVLAMP